MDTEPKVIYRETRAAEPMTWILIALAAALAVAGALSSHDTGRDARKRDQDRSDRSD